MYFAIGLLFLIIALLNEKIFKPSKDRKGYLEMKRINDELRGSVK